ncbi:hypothetical protein FIBSPDRAFT_847321 [Athelia psychrophila]|uniref:Uncharacterized protein n=1 Tax=Athelia psychrophila TaxID=1759441 RepID=A0A166W5T5_9AGAM|nr:hypothetical protein FIBSPDRAFT_847321 [Fibularhizoctonia sp. CBS 109695]
MGRVDGSICSLGTSRLTFDYILSRLQGELQQIRETSAKLHNLAGAVTDIHDINSRSASVFSNPPSSTATTHPITTLGADCPSICAQRPPGLVP